MSQQQKQVRKAPSVSGTFNLVPGIVERKTVGKGEQRVQIRRKYVAARFPEKTTRPALSEYIDEDAKKVPREDCTLAYAQPQQQQQSLIHKQPNSKQQQDEGEQLKLEPSLLITRKQLLNSSNKRLLQGIPQLKQETKGRRAAETDYYFLLYKEIGKGSNDFFVRPLDATLTFKTVARAPVGSIEDVEAQMRSAAAAADPARILPKSMRQQLQEAAAAEAAEQQLMQEMAPLFDPSKVAEMTAKYGSGGSSGAQGKLVVGHSEDEGSDEGWGLTGGEGEEEGQGAGRKRGPGKDKEVKGGKGTKGRKGGKAGIDIPDDERPEDIFAGEDDELRPEAPVEDADWDFQNEAADDDLEQGYSEEEKGWDDDPGMRKEIGLNDLDEEEAAKEAGLAPEDEEGADKPGETPAAADAAAAAAAGPSQGGSVESESVMDEDDLPVGLEGEDFDVEALDRLAEGRDIIPGDGASTQPSKRRKGSVGALGRDHSPAPSRLATPPLSTAAAAAAAGGGSRATPPLGGARRGSTPPQGSKAAGDSSRQAAGGGSSRKTPPLGGGGGPRRTPPPAAAAAAAAGAGAGAAKRKREDAAVSGAMAAAAGVGGGAAAAAPRGYQWRPDQLDATGIPTVEAVAAALRDMGPILTGQLSLLQDHLDTAAIGEAGKKELKMRVLQVAKVENRDGQKYVVLKPNLLM